MDQLLLSLEAPLHIKITLLTQDTFYCTGFSLVYGSMPLLVPAYNLSWLAQWPSGISINKTHIYQLPGHSIDVLDIIGDPWHLDL